MKKLLIILLLSVVFIPFAHAGDSKPIEMKLGHFAADAHEGNLASKMFAEAVEKRTNGAIKITIYPNNALGAPPEVLEQNILGAVDMSLPTQGQLGKYSKKFNCVMLPFVFNDYAQADKVLDGPFLKWAAPDLDKAGLVFLSNWEWGFRNLTNSKHPVNVPADVKGLKIRTIQTPTYVAALNAMGANATPMAFGEVYTAMQTGVLDGFEHGSAVIKAQKFYEVSKYIALTQHLFGPLVFAYSKKEWAGLTDKEKAVIMDGAKMARDVQRTLGPLREQEAFDFLKTKGMVINKIDTSGFRKNAVAVQDKFAKEVGASDLLEIIRATN